MAWLTWINDSDLEKEVYLLLEKAQKAKSKSSKDFRKNVIDPFAAIFEIAGFEQNFETWIRSEQSRQAQKTLQNHIGEFHQNILGYCINWENLSVGNVVDLVSIEHKIIAEVKNKYNTLSGGRLADQYATFDNLISPKLSVYKGYTAFLVTIIPQKRSRFNRTFTPSNKEKGERCPTNENIREIDGASFYSLVTGDPCALENLYRILPSVIEKCTEGKIRLTDSDKLLEFYNAAFE